MLDVEDQSGVAMPMAVGVKRYEQPFEWTRIDCCLFTKLMISGIDALQIYLTAPFFRYPFRFIFQWPAPSRPAVASGDSESSAKVRWNRQLRLECHSLGVR